MSVLSDVISTLDQIEVKGENNLYYMLGAIQTLKKLEAAQQQALAKKPEEEEKNG